MNVLNKFTFRSLKLNKKRTIVTVIGIMLSSALICGLVGLVSSFQQTFINMAKDCTGNFHTRFYDVSKEDVSKIEELDFAEQVFIYAEKGTAYLDGTKNEYKPYISVLEYDKTAFDNNGLRLVEGRLPENNNEILISSHIIDNARVNLKVGDMLTIDVGTRVNAYDGTKLNQNDPYRAYYDEADDLKYNEKIINTESKTYTIVGIIKRPDYTLEGFSSPAYTVITSMDEVPENVEVSVLYKIPTDYEENNDYILNIIGKSKETFVNKELLRYQGAMSSQALSVIYGIAAVVMVIIVSSSIFVIRNSFSISVSEKNRQYGMLSSIGATKKQIRKTVLTEGLLIGLIAIPLGVLFGVIAIVILLQVVNYLLEFSLNGMEFVYSLPIVPVLISVAISAITIYFSCLIPAYRAGKITPIEAIRGNNDVKIKAKKIRTPKYIKKIFGIGGVIASKNLKRCKSKYATTVISIVISITIFVSLFAFLFYGNKTSDLYYTELKCNMMVTTDSRDDRLKAFKRVLEFNNIVSYAYYYESSIPIAKEQMTDFGKNLFDTSDPNIAVLVCNSKYFKEYLKDIGINESMYDQGGVLIDEYVVYNTDGTKTLSNVYSIKAGDDVNVELANRNSINILAKTSEKPMGYEMTYMDGGILVVSDDYIKDVEYQDNFIIGDLYIKSNDATKLENTINDLAKENPEIYGGIRVTNIETMVEAQNRVVLLIAIFLYGFITVITLISITNIFNTITTNMILRSKEFAMLKSIGMTKKEFNKMIRLESILYGLKSLAIGIPIGIFGSYMIYKSFAENIDSGYVLPVKAILLSIVFVFLIVGLTMKYSLSKINKQNIIETIRNDNI